MDPGGCQELGRYFECERTTDRPTDRPTDRSTGCPVAARRKV
jgi:hypothetical protein